MTRAHLRSRLARPRALLGLALLVGALAAGVLALSGCGGTKEDPILQLSAQEALEEGKKLMAQGHWAPARKYLIHAFEVEPNSASGREGLLLAADCYFKAGGEDNLIKAEARYRDFVNRFPTSDHAAYAQFQIGLTLSKRIAKPDRDQSIAKQAISALEDVERFYPTSDFAAQAKQERELVAGRLADHDFLVGRFYERYGLPNSAIDRYVYLLDNYPEYAERDKVLYHLCEAYLSRKAKGDAELAHATCDRLQSEYPESEYVEKIPKRWPEEPATKEQKDSKEPAEAAAGADPSPTPSPPARDRGL
jgi:outer membrane protein assembly factor BamD